MVLSRQEHWSGLPFPSPGDLPDPGIETGPGWMHETSARGWCTGKTQRDRVEREVGGGIGIGNTCNSMADSCQCMTKPTTIL